MFELTIGRRFRGPSASANGGYASGRLAAFVDAPAVEVTLRLPPPLDRPLGVMRDGNRALLVDGEAIVAEAVPGEPGIDPPAPVSLAAAEEAAARHVRWGGEDFSECFTCGVRPGDGLCIHVGPVAGSAPRRAVDCDRGGARDRVGGDRLPGRLRGGRARPRRGGARPDGRGEGEGELLALARQTWIAPRVRDLQPVTE